MAYRREAPASLALAPEQQAEVVAVIGAAGLDASEYVWAVQPNSYDLIGPLVSALVHTPTGYSFRFEFLESALGQNRRSSAQERPRWKKNRGILGGSQLGQVREWLIRLADAKE